MIFLSFAGGFILGLVLFMPLVGLYCFIKGEW